MFLRYLFGGNCKLGYLDFFYSQKGPYGFLSEEKL
jgi:hypothetical protein